jgi:PKD repeat protein
MIPSARGLIRSIPGLLATSLLTAMSPGANAQTTSPSTTVPPYLVSDLPGVAIESILTVDDGTIPRAGGGTTRLVGIPDGLGAIDGADLTPAEPGFFYLLVNHELVNNQGSIRDHGNVGAFVSKWKIDKATHAVVEGSDLIQQFFDWNEGASAFVPASTSFDRLCSADRPAPSALFNPGTGLGTQEILFLNGEETSGGRALGHVVTGPNAGNSYQLEHLGFAAFENVVLSPFAQDTTVAMMMDDDVNGEVYVYVGTKRNAGNEVEKAGLVGGNLYAIAVPGKPFELADVRANAVGSSESFVLKLIGTPGSRPINGTDMEARGADTLTPVQPGQNFASLKMGGPEDGAWDTRPGFENRFYFVTKGTASNGINAPTRIWQLEFTSVANPALGGTLTLLHDGPENRLGSLDNLTFDVVGGLPKLLIQEDLGGDAPLSKIWMVDLSSGLIEEVASHDPDRFFPNGATFLTTNEESSGIISLADVLGAGWYAASVQAHTSTGLSNPGELVERGQLLLLDLGARGADVQRERLVASGDAWSYRVDGVDPGSTWNDVGFVPGAGWNTTTAGTPTGALPTPIGYGEAAGVLASDLVAPAAPRPAASYFRREFDLASPAGVVLLDLFMKIDDGAVVSINGVEVARFNMSNAAAVTNTTFATANEPAERDWKHVPINTESLSLQATGNVLAVSIHQENSASSDIRMDAELIAWNDSPDPGTAPAVPSGVAIGSATETQLTLNWTPQSDAKLFRIERKISSDVAWKVVEPEFPGSFSSYVDAAVASGTSYDYRISAVNLHGRSANSAVATGATSSSFVPTIFEENFNVTASLGKFTAVDVLEPNARWRQVLWDFGSTGAAQGNNFGAGNTPTEDWLITTSPINFLFHQEETLEYDSQISFGGPSPQVLVSTNYDPIVHTNPNSATWTVIHTDTSATATLTKVGPFSLSGVGARGYLAFKYTGNGGAAGQSKRVTIDDVLVKGQCGFDFAGGEDASIGSDPASPWTVVNASSAAGWNYDTVALLQGAVNNNFGSAAGGTSGGTAADDWLISPPLSVGGPSTAVLFDYYERFGDTNAQPLAVLVTDAWTGDPSTTAWTDITPLGLNGSTSDAWVGATSQSFAESGSNVRIAFRYRSNGNGGGTTKRIGVDEVCVQPLGGALAASFTFTRNGGNASFIPTVSGGVPPYTYAWTFGDGGVSSASAPTHPYTSTGLYTVSVTVTDSLGTNVTSTQIDAVEVTSFAVPAKVGELRVATFNASMNRTTAGALATALAAGTDAQIRQVAEVVQRTNPDVVLLNEVDVSYSGASFDEAAMETAVANFKANYLGVAQAPDTSAVTYPYHFIGPVNTGVPSGLDLNNDGDTVDPEDAFGFGEFPGKFGFIVLSKHPIDEPSARTFQQFLWKDMPGALLPPDPDDTDGDLDLTSYYNAAELDVFRLSSKSHWDLPIDVPGVGIVHLLASHPTPPVFDDGTSTVYPSPTVADWNGLRNHDEIRFWADYVHPTNGSYIYDDDEWAAAGFSTPTTPDGGLAPGSLFVIAGDQNADPDDGDASFDPISLLLSSPQVQATPVPSSAGALQQVPVSFTNRQNKTASFNLRADYVLPRATPTWSITNAFVFWPETTDLEADLLAASDHRAVVVDLDAVPEPATGIALGAGTAFLAWAAGRRRQRSKKGDVSRSEGFSIDS